MTTTAMPVHVGERYEAALVAYLAEPEERGLLGGYEIGRAALGEGLGVLELTAIHLRVVGDIIGRGLTDAERRRLFESHTAFLIEALSPFEMAHRAFRDANTSLRRLNDMLEAQAKRIAYALHSEAGQLLASVHFALADASQGLSAEKAVHINKVRTLLGEMEERLRNISHELRPPVLDDLGLASALEFLAESVSSRWGLPVTVTVSLKGDLPASIETTLYRIAQEALTNAAKHAGANRVDIELRQDDRAIVCSVRDDGVGFDGTGGFRKRRPGLGLTEIKERVAALGGVVQLALNEDRGTDLRIEIPMET